MHSHLPKTSTWKMSRLSAHLMLAGLLIALVALSAGAQQQQMFGRLFPELPAYDAPTDAALDALTTAGTATSPGPLLDDGANTGNNPDGVRAFFTYFGQFLDHDMTLDTLPLPVDFVDPNTIVNNRDQRLNLDSVYGSRKRPNPALYEADGKKLKVGGGQNGRDLPRESNGTAIIGDPRNDENQIIAQIHVAFLRAHNKLIDAGFKFEDARQLMEWRHQWIVVNEFLPEVLDPDVYDDVFRANRNQPHITQIHTRYYDPSNAAKAEMPVEFSVGAYRFGHSQVRAAYRIVEGGGFIQVFNRLFDPPAVDDLRGGRPIAPEHTIFWPNFLNVEGFPAAVNISRKIDTLLSAGLFTLPIPGAEAADSAILAKRNIQRAREYGLPSGQAVAARLGIDVLTNEEIATAIPRLGALRDDPAYQGEAPLWLYILAESQIVHDGAKLGPVGSRIVAEVIGGLLAADNTSYIRRGFVPQGGSFRVQDLLVEAGVLTVPPAP
jgi:Animal haem peroxidase